MTCQEWRVERGPCGRPATRRITVKAVTVYKCATHARRYRKFPGAVEEIVAWV